MLCFSFQALPSDGLPPIVCFECREQLDTCHRFRRVAHQSNKTLNSFLKYTSNLNGSPQVSRCTFSFLFNVGTSGNDSGNFFQRRISTQKSILQHTDNYPFPKKPETVIIDSILIKKLLK